ncbi:TAT-dependent nitrous-oxide reductase [Massilia sp. YMA4]|uniref:TAT-dependent nitrous-oxide reductase n=1 Tax=Massilia sp. YMA4 TaxID=1593482 RepID=UPI000DD10365|nr:TAT-dependent nitrous-oxide reductase [Massilia sp. YMA4]AXA92197.1 TAT-dependent nitrous-oxide reductase [Massilia sp. YMA4]
MDSSKDNNKNGSATAVEHGRRGFLGKGAALGLAGVTLGLAACKEQGAGAKPADAKPHQAGGGSEIAPGQLDEYYAFISAGHAGEARILGIPSGRTLKRIPVFNVDCMVGWGITNESKAIIGTKPDGSLLYNTGDTHHVHGSYKDGTYDGRWLFVNDKIHSRLARIRMDTMECDKITQLPNVMGFHGIFTDKRDPVDPKIDYTTRVFCGAEFHIPLPNDGHDLDDPSKWGALFSCVSAETMEVLWQCRVDGNMDLVATSYDGKLAASNQYNVENAADLNGMMSAERDACVFFHVERIERLVKEGKFTTIGASKVPVIDGRKAANPDPKTAVTCYVPVSKNPHGVNASPDGKYFVCSGKLSPTATVIELAKVLQWFDGGLKDARDAVVAEPEIGLGPLHTAFDGRGNAYTSLFLDSQCVKWNVDAAIAQFKGDKNAKVILEKMDVHYQPGHNYASMGETREADGKYLNSGNKFSKDRFLPVGPLHVETEQLIDISGDKMRLIADHTAYSEPHDGIIVKRDLVKTRQIYNMDDFPNAVKPENAGIERHGNKVHVRLMSQAPSYSMPVIKVRKGDEVTITLTNHDKVEDLTHGLALPTYNINFIVNPQETKSVTFKADHAGAFWMYCTHFCHALHLEMRSRFLVEA